MERYIDQLDELQDSCFKKRYLTTCYKQNRKMMQQLKLHNNLYLQPIMNTDDLLMYINFRLSLRNHIGDILVSEGYISKVGVPGYIAWTVDNVLDELYDNAMKYSGTKQEESFNTMLIALHNKDSTDSEYIGFVQYANRIFDDRTRCTFIINAYIEEDYRGNGYFRHIIESIKESFQPNSIELLCLKLNPASIAYERIGFEPLTDNSRFQTTWILKTHY